jgi:hypothetical protein
LEVGLAPAPPHVATLLDLPQQAEVLVRRYLLVVDGEPVQLADSYFPAELAEGSNIGDRENITPGRIDADLKERFGLEAARFLDELTVRMPTAEETRSLQLPPGTPVVSLLRTYRDPTGKPFEVAHFVLPVTSTSSSTKVSHLPGHERTTIRGTMTALHPDLNLGRPLQALREVGAAFIPHALSEPFQQRLQHEIQDGPFERLPDQIGPVRQQADLFVSTDAMTAYPALAQLRAEFVTRLRQGSPQLAGLARWWPNQAYVQRYEPGALGVSPHLDSKRFTVLVAIFTTKGSARFALCQTRAGEIIQEWDAGSGSLTLLRGPGLLDAEDHRPFHTVHGPATGRRYSITFRMTQERREDARSAPP